MKRGDLIASAEKYEAQHPGVWAISVFSWPGATVGEIARRAGLPHVDLRKSTADRIRSAVAPDNRRFHLVKTGREGHYTVVLPSPPGPGDWDLLDQLFDRPEPNPAAQEVSADA
jgi:hypothetical protein